MTAAARVKSFEELYAEIQDLPEGSQGEILTPGEILITMGRPAKPHRRAAKLVQNDLRDADQEVGGTERVAELPSENPIAIVPDWVCEVLSPTTAKKDLSQKLPLYAKEGVPFIWIVDPEIRLVQVYAAENGRPTLIATASDEDAVRLPPFDLDMHPGRWWLPVEGAKTAQT